MFEPKTEGMLTIGKETENGSRHISIDVLDLRRAYPGKTINLMLIRPGETEEQAYPAATNVLDGEMIFTPSEADLAYTGYGRWEIWLTEGDWILKPYGGTTYIKDAIKTSGEVPPPGADWAREAVGAVQAHAADAGIHVSAEDREKWDQGRDIDLSKELNDLDFNSTPITEDAQIVVQDSATKWVRRKADMIWQWMRDKIFAAFVSVNPQGLTEDQQAQARANISVPLGGDRHLAQNASEGYISIASATSFETGYKCPCDGKVQIRKNGGTAYLHEDNYTVMSVTDGTTCSWVTQGSVVWHTGTPNAVNFIPYVKGALK